MSVKGCDYTSPEGQCCPFNPGGYLSDVYSRNTFASFKAHEEATYCALHHPSGAVFPHTVRAKFFREVIYQISHQKLGLLELPGIRIDDQIYISNLHLDGNFNLSDSTIASVIIDDCRCASLNISHSTWGGEASVTENSEQGERTTTPAETQDDVLALCVMNSLIGEISAKGSTFSKKVELTLRFSKGHESLAIEGGQYSNLDLSWTVRSALGKGLSFTTETGPRVRLNKLSSTRLNARCTVIGASEEMKIRGGSLTIEGGQHAHVDIEGAVYKTTFKDTKIIDSSVEVIVDSDSSALKLENVSGTKMVVNNVRRIDYSGELELRELNVRGNGTVLYKNRMDTGNGGTGKKYAVNINNIHLTGSFYSASLNGAAIGRKFVDGSSSITNLLMDSAGLLLDATISNFSIQASRVFGFTAVGQNCTHIEKIVLSESEFRYNCIFSTAGTAVKFDEISVSHCTFGKQASFAYATIAKKLIIEECDFETVPDFDGASLPATTHIDENNAFSLSEPAPDVARLRVLRKCFEEKRSRREEGFFFMHEQRALRKLSAWWKPERLLSYLYDVLGNYGQSYWKPLISLMLLTVFMVPIYSTQFDDVEGACLDCTISEAALKRGTRFSIQQAVAPFYAWRKTGSDQASLSLLGLAMIQSILSIALITMMVIALRWRFRRA